jgi:hypothetical protein
MPTGTIIIPTTTNESQDVIAAAKQHLAEHFGGYSCYEGEGGWINSEGDLIEENHVRLEATHTFGVRLRTEFCIIAHNVKHFCNEGEVFVQFRDDEINPV